MKILLAVLLVAAIGASAYFYFSKKQKHSSANIQQELIVGKWKIDSLDVSRTTDSSANLIGIILAASDSDLHKYVYDFRKDGSIYEILNGRVKDTSHYEFAGDKGLAVWRNADTTKTSWTINKLDSTSLIVREKDSTIFSFSKLK